MKEKTKFKAALLTMVFSIINTMVVSVLGLIYNNLIIKYYGSSINGLISTLTQFVSLFTIIEGGFSVASVVSSYDSIVKKDYRVLNNILYTTKKYLRKISILFMIVSLIIGLIYLNFVDSPLSSLDTITMLIMTIISTSLSFGVLSCYTVVMSGHNSGYMTSFILTISKFVTWGFSIILILKQNNIVLVYFFNVINIILNIWFLKRYIKMHYPYITYKGEYDKNSIHGTKDVLFQKITGTIFSSTDLVLISIGINVAMSSVYNLYNQIFQVIFHFLISVVEAPFNSFGQLFSKGETEKVKVNFSIFQKEVQIISTILLSTAGMSILAFIKIYTKSVTDINYVVPSLAILFYSQFYLQLNNRPYGNILNASGNFKMQNVQCGIAALLNIVLSIILMNWIGISGVILGSVIGTLIILIMNIYQCCKYVVADNIKYHLIQQIINYVVGLFLIIVFLKINISYSSYILWSISGMTNMIFSGFLIISINYIFDYNRTKEAIKFLYDKAKIKLNKK